MMSSPGAIAKEWQEQLALRLADHRRLLDCAHQLQGQVKVLEDATDVSAVARALREVATSNFASGMPQDTRTLAQLMMTAVVDDPTLQPLHPAQRSKKLEATKNAMENALSNDGAASTVTAGTAVGGPSVAGPPPPPRRIGFTSAAVVDLATQQKLSETTQMAQSLLAEKHALKTQLDALKRELGEKDDLIADLTIEVESLRTQREQWRASKAGSSAACRR